jgi:hypothetical protein
MQTGIIRRRRDSLVVGRWRADARAIVVETADLELRTASDEILETPQSIPVHAADHYAFAAQAERTLEAPSTIKYLALFALGLEERGYDLEPDEGLEES